MRLLIAEPAATGHHMALYVRNIVRAAIRRGWQPHLLTTREAAAHPAFDLVKGEARGNLPVHLMPSVQGSAKTDAASLLMSQLRYFRSFAAGYRGIDPAKKPEHIYVANLDYCDKIMAVLGSPFGQAPVSGLMMSIRYHQRTMATGPASRNDAVYEWAFRRLLRHQKIHRVAAIDEPLLEYVRRSKHQEYGKICLVPEPGELHGDETRERARAALGIAPDRFVVLVYGSLTLRKGIRQLLNSIAGDYFAGGMVLLAGTPDLAVSRLLAEPAARSLIEQGRLTVELGFCDSAKEYRMFRASDAVWVGYSLGFYGSSGVFYQAGSIGLPVLTPPYGLLRWLTDRYQTGLCCNPDNPSDVASAIRKLMEEPELRRRLAVNGHTLAQSHTGDSFGDAVCDMILDA